MIDIAVATATTETYFIVELNAFYYDKDIGAVNLFSTDGLSEFINGYDFPHLSIAGAIPNPWKSNAGT